MSKFLMIFVFTLVSASSFAAGREYVSNCTEFSEPIPGKYCISKVEGSQSQDVIYYLHGAGGSAEEWSTEGTSQEFLKTWDDLYFQPPTVISISYGVFWLLAEKNSSEYSGLFTHFTQYLMPKVEAELGGIKGQRMILGVSMGGFNTAQLLTKKADLFSKVAMACPATALITPFSTEEEIQSHIAQYGLDPKLIGGYIELAKLFFPDVEAWNTADPFVLGAKYFSSKTPRLHISCGTEDELGFYPGSKAFYELAKSKGVDVQYQAVPGGHCAFDPIAIATFLSK